MIKVDCSGLTLDEHLALASTISDELQGRSLALVSGEDIVIDHISGPRLDSAVLLGIVERFISKRKQAKDYAVERDGDTIVVQSPDPVAVRRSRAGPRTPPGAYQCPACGLILADKGRYQTHVRVHDLVRGLR